MDDTQGEAMSFHGDGNGRVFNGNNERIMDAHGFEVLII